MLLLVEVNIPFLHSFNTLCVRGIRNRKQKEIDSVILLIDYSKFCLFYNVKVFEKMYFRNFMDFLDFGFFWFFGIFWDFLGFFRKNPRVYEDFFELTTPRHTINWRQLARNLKAVMYNILFPIVSVTYIWTNRLSISGFLHCFSHWFILRTAAHCCYMHNRVLSR